MPAIPGFCSWIFLPASTISSHVFGRLHARPCRIDPSDTKAAGYGSAPAGHRFPPTNLPDAKNGVGIALEVNPPRGEILVDRRQVLVDERRDPDVHRGDDVEVLRARRPSRQSAAREAPRKARRRRSTLIPVFSAKSATFFACAVNWVDCTASTLNLLAGEGLAWRDPGAGRHAVRGTPQPRRRRHLCKARRRLMRMNPSLVITRTVPPRDFEVKQAFRKTLKL